MSRLCRIRGAIRHAAVVAGALALLGAPPASASVVASVGELRVETAPFRLATADVATVAGTGGLPVRAPGVDGPLPVEPLGGVGAFPAVGWVVGARAGLVFPVSFFSGNRLFGAEAGAVVAVSGVRSARRDGEGYDLVLDTTAGLAATATLRPRPGGGARIAFTPPAGLPVVSSMFTLASPPDEGLYGLGGRKDRFDQRGVLRNVWVEQQNISDQRLDGVGSVLEPDYTFPNGAQAAYYVEPALFGSRGWAVWTEGFALGRVDLAASRADAVRWGVASPALDVSFAGGGLTAASRAYTASVGRAPAPPTWVYEPWVDVLNEGEGEAAPNGAGFNGGPRVKDDIDGIVRAAREHALPIGVIGVEGWHKVLDGEGPQAKAYFAGLRRDGFHLSAYWNPFTAEAGKGYAEAAAKDLFVKDAFGQPYTLITNRNNPAKLIDFSAPGAAAYWRGQLDRSAALGFEGFMEDFGELIVDGMTQADGLPAALAHNAYPVRYHAAGRAAIDAERSKTFHPWFYVRSGFRGVSRSTSGVFPGDESTDWSAASGIGSVVPAMLNHTLTGVSTFTTDVGGYLDLLAPRTTPELLTRWSQLAAFTPVLRIHNSTGKHSLFPWEAGAEALDAFRRYARAKTRLIPLVDAWSHRAAATGEIGPVRPLVLDDPAAREVDDEWLLGRDVLVAPVLSPGATSRRVVLPSGATWQRVRIGSAGEFVPVGDAVAGGRTVTVPVTAADIPLFLRAVSLRVSRRCLKGGRLRVRLTGADTGVVRKATLSARRLPLTVRRSSLKRLRVRVVLEEGRVLTLARRLPSCRPRK